MRGSVGRSITPRCLAAGLCCLVAFGAVASGAQNAPAVPVPPQAESGTAAAAPDTAVGILVMSAAAPSPVGWVVLPDTVWFGGTVTLVVDLPANEGVLPEIAPLAGQEWLVPAPRPERSWLDKLLRRQVAGPLPDVDLPAAVGPRLVSEFQVYRLNPFRIELDGRRSEVIHVRGRAPDATQTAVIRGPRSLGWPFWTLLALAVVLVLIVAGVWILLGRRSPGVDWEDRRVRVPAWVATALELRDLLKEDLLARGDPRGHLDRLAGIARRFAAGHFAIPAQEMTGAEISAACIGLGHPAERVRGLALLIDEADQRRYDPALPAASWSAATTGEFFAILEQARIMPRFVTVETETLAAADRAWVRLEREFGATAGVR